MLDAGGNAIGLDAPHHCRGQLAGEQRVLRKIFKISPAQRAAMDVDGRRKPDPQVVFFEFRAARAAHRLGQVRIPSAGQQGSAGPCGSENAGPWLDAHSSRAVRRHHIGDGIVRVVPDAKSDAHSGVRLTAQQIRQFFIVHLLQKLFHRRIPLGHVEQSACAFFAGRQEQFAVPRFHPRRKAFHLFFRQRRQFIFFRLVPVLPGQFFQLASGVQSPRQARWCQPGAQLFQHNVLFAKKGARKSGHLSRAAPNAKAVLALFQHPGPPADSPDIIKHRQFT